MNPRKLVKLSIRGVPVIPLLLSPREGGEMGITVVAATLVANYNVSSSVTINTNFTFSLVSFTGATGAACGSGTTGAAFTTASYGSVSGASASSTNSTQWCFKNTGNSAIFVGQFAPETFFAVSSGSLPSGASEAAKAWVGTLSTTANYCIPVGAYQLFDATCTSVSVPGSLVLQLSVAANTPAGSYSWTDTFHGYSTASG